MKYFKRFTDFCAGFSAFMVAIRLFGKFMGYNPEKAEGMVEKFKLFFAKDNTGRGRDQLVLIILFVVSLVVSRVFERLPYVTMAVSVLPLVQTFFVFADKRFFEYSWLHIIFAVLHTTGSLVFALNLDRADGKRRAFWAVNLFGVCVSAYVIPIVRRMAEFADIEAKDKYKLLPFESKLQIGIENGADEILIRIALMIVIAVVISVILRDIYFIDVALAVVPFVYSLYVFSTKNLKSFALECFMLTTVYFVFRIAIMFFEPMRKKQKKVKGIET